MAGKNDAGLLLLIAIACVAIIVGVGYYLVGEYRSQQQEKKAAQRQLADKVLREGCLDDLDAIVSIDQSHPYIIANCLYAGALS